MQMAKLLKRQTYCRFLTINLFYVRTQSKSAHMRLKVDTTLMVNKLCQRLLWGILCSLTALPMRAAEVQANGTTLAREGGDIVFTIALTQETPFKAYTLDNPRRLLVDLGDTSVANIPRGLARDLPEISALRFGIFQLGEARIVLDLAAPLVIESALASKNGITIRLTPASPEGFAAVAVINPVSLWKSAQLVPEIVGAADAPLIAIDAGHGGLDSGAQQEGILEKDIVLQVAHILRDVLLQDGQFRVLLTRESDVFIPLGERVEIARRAGARAFVSLHADVVTLGRARGTTVFSLSEAGEDQQAVTIATLENRADLVAGISVEGEDDQLTQILLQLAHRETDALSNRFADTMAEVLWFQNDTDIKSRRMAGGFRVLRAPDIPSVLVEMGFMSDKTDLEKLQNPEWQLSMAETLRDGLTVWLKVEAEMRGLLRN